MLKSIIKLLIFLFVTFSLQAQIKIPGTPFISPVDIPIKLSGTFGELRPDHFHSGIDIKTGESEGLNVYAIGSGYISRIKIQAGGYGKALYITHPDGFVSVYAHLSRFNDKINEYVVRNQYERQSYELDLYPDPSDFRVSQGEIVAYSGNTGRSGGPHLHFEIRTEADQKPFNPLLMGFDVNDKQAPVINLLKIYPVGPHSQVEGRNKPVEFQLTENLGRYVLYKKDTVHVAGSFYTGVNTIDLFYGGLNKNGIYSMQVEVDDFPIYSHTFNTFSFDETRYINSLIDYREYQENNRMVQRGYVQPNNHLSIYGPLENRGIISCGEGDVRNLVIKIADVSGNTSVLQFIVKGVMEKNNKQPVEQKKPKGTLFTFKGNNSFTTPEIQFLVPGEALYDTLTFTYERVETKNGYAALHRLHNDQIPLHTWCTLSIKADLLPAYLREKAVLARTDKKTGLKSVGGEWKESWITASVREFGSYTITVDTVPPVITPVNIHDQKSLLAQQSIRLTIRDEFSGISAYKPTLNNNWILMEYDEKNDLLIYNFDKYLLEGENKFRIEVWDKRNNFSSYEAILYY